MRAARRAGVITALLAVIALAGAAPAWADPPHALQANAPAADLRFQPATDYDTDGCYPTPAIGPDGTLNPGLNNSGALNGSCRDRSDLDNTNSYSRSACNNGWCAYMYDYYFEKDQAVAGLDCCGHRHEWENIVVWVRDDRVQYVSASQHTGYQTLAVTSSTRFQGTHVEMVYHKDGASTHDWRFAKTDGGDEPPENHYHAWQYPALVGWDDWPAGLRDKVVANWPSGICPKIQDSQFATYLAKAKPAGIAFDPNALSGNTAATAIG